MTHRLAVVGSRDFPDESYWVVRYEIQRIGHRLGWDMTLVSGGARGVDTMAERAAAEFDIPIRVHRAEWKRYGRRAGMIRNEMIVADADEMLAFFADQPTPGTSDSIRRARAKGIPVHVFSGEGLSDGLSEPETAA